MSTKTKQASNWKDSRRIRIEEHYARLGATVHWIAGPASPMTGERPEGWFAYWKLKKYYAFKLDVDPIDECWELGGFWSLLPYDDSSSEIWTKHKHAFPRHATFTHGGWKWWGGYGVTLEFVLDLLGLVKGRYAAAVTEYERQFANVTDYNPAFGFAPTVDAAKA